MGEMAREVLKWAFRIGFVFAVVMTFILLWNVILAGLSMNYNSGVLSEIFYFVQIWLPFDLGAVFGFIMTAASIVIFYYLSMWAYNRINNLVG